MSKLHTEKYKAVSDLNVKVQLYVNRQINDEMHLTNYRAYLCAIFLDCGTNWKTVKTFLRFQMSVSWSNEWFCFLRSYKLLNLLWLCGTCMRNIYVEFIQMQITLICYITNSNSILLKCVRYKYVGGYSVAGNCMLLP